MTNPFALIVEDDTKLADIFSIALQAARYDTQVANDGTTALARLAETKPDIVILDLHLPHVSGRDILKHIRADQRLADTRVMLATADALLAEQLLRPEADLVLLKPISVNQLRDLAMRFRPVETT